MLRLTAFPLRISVLAVALLAALFVVACGGGSNAGRDGVSVEPAVGGKPAPPAAQTLVAETPVPSRPTADGTVAPNSGRWIDVDVTRYVVRLMDGTTATRVLQPVGVGAEVDTGAYESTQTGTFHVYQKIQPLQYDAPYKTYISDWVGFDQARANGFHSFLKDASGKVVDPSTGRISNGCIRTDDSAAIFAYAEMGMAVYVHF